MKTPDNKNPYAKGIPELCCVKLYGTASFGKDLAGEGFNTVPKIDFL